MPTHPECPMDPSMCRIRQVGMSMVTQIDWHPVYDGHGVMTNVDPNTYRTEFACGVCMGEWAEVRTGTEVATETVKAPEPPTAEQAHG